MMEFKSWSSNDSNWESENGVENSYKNYYFERLDWPQNFGRARFNKKAGDLYAGHGYNVREENNIHIDANYRRRCRNQFGRSTNRVNVSDSFKYLKINCFQFFFVFDLYFLNIIASKLCPFCVCNGKNKFCFDKLLIINSRINDKI